jgi:YesN/AraC family two-component response regulator
MLKAVVVDDETRTESIIRYFIEHEGLPLEIVASAPNGKLGVAEIRKHKPDVVFLDIQMPVMNGFEVMAEEPDQKYIIVTAYDEFSYAQKALRLGAADILLKPVELAQLIQSIERATGWRMTGNDTVNDIMEYIRKHYAEKISLTQIAERFYLTQSHVARLFKKHTGDNVLNYINRIRIENAKKLLEDGVSVKDAADQVGYDSLNNFYKYFKRYTGTTPAEYH